MFQIVEYNNKLYGRLNADFHRTKQVAFVGDFKVLIKDKDTATELNVTARTVEGLSCIETYVIKDLEKALKQASSSARIELKGSYETKEVFQIAKDLYLDKFEIHQEEDSKILYGHDYDIITFKGKKYKFEDYELISI